ncbi:hypothetical protein N7445_005010 [Penicillium cf. griseofulvum]|nr:hypothetical protein N7445_005010 [Penicillium cf. griseofulvum]
MSGVEVIGAISAVISLIETSINIYNSARKDLELPETFAAVGSRLPVIINILQTCKDDLGREEDSMSSDVAKGLENIVDACDAKARKIRDVFEKVIPGAKDGWRKRYSKILKSIGKGNKVERLMASITEDIQLLVNHHAVTSVQPEQNLQLEYILREMKSLESSTSDDELTTLNINEGPRHSKHDYPPPSKFPIHAVKITDNPLFVGRKVQLDNLYNILVAQNNESNPVACTLHGNPGVGKTETALQFASQYKDKFDASFWVNADPHQGTETLRTFCNIGIRLGLFEDEEIHEGKIESIIRWFSEAEQSWLLIFDNVVDWISIARYWPNSSKKNSAIIITSQQTTPWVPTSNLITMEYLNEDVGCTLLLRRTELAGKRVKDHERHLARQISNELGGSPLYLSIADGFMAHMDKNNELTVGKLKEYLEFIRASSSALSHKSGNTWRYEHAATATHDGLIQRLDPDAVNLLYMLSFMSPDISEDFLLGDHGDDSLEFLRDKSTYLGYATELSSSSLVQRDRSTMKQADRGAEDQCYLRMHRSTREAMLLRLNKHTRERELAFKRVISLLREHFPPPSKLQIANAEVWPRLTKVLPHILSAMRAFERARPQIKGNEFLAELLSDIAGMDLYDRGLITEAYELNRTVGKILDSLHCPLETPLRGDALTILGLCTDNMALSKRREGLEIREKCQIIRQRCFEDIPTKAITREDRIRLYNSYTDLVCSKQQLNDFEGVRQILRECFKQYQRWGRQDDNDLAYEYAKYYNHMSYVLLWEGKDDQAVESAKKAWQLVERAAPNTGISRLYQSDYAHILFQKAMTGDEGTESKHKAFDILKVLLFLSEQECGKDNVRTQEIRLNVGAMSYFIGDLNYAEDQLRNVITTGEKIAGWPEENTIRGQYYLSQVLKNNFQGYSRVGEALKLEKKAKEKLDKILKLDTTEMASKHRGNDPMLFDYLVHWENRLITPRKQVSRFTQGLLLIGSWL